jgi:hypothetical protein
VEDHFPTVIPLRYARIFPTSTVSPAMILRQCRSCRQVQHFVPGLLFKGYKPIPCISMQNGGCSVSPVHCSLQECLGKFPTCGLGPKMQIWLGGDRSSAPEFPAVSAAFQSKGSRDQSSEKMRHCARNKPSSIRELTRRGESSTYQRCQIPAWILDSAFY